MCESHQAFGLKQHLSFERTVAQFGGPRDRIAGQQHPTGLRQLEHD